jgi:hypothetical protein
MKVQKNAAAKHRDNTPRPKPDRASNNRNQNSIRKAGAPVARGQHKFQKKV